MHRCAWITLLALALTGCATPKKEPPPKPFTGTRWEVLLELPVQGEQPYFRFGDGRVEGYGGCNQVTARYVQDTVGARAIAIGRMEVGRRACDSSSRAAEARLLEVLQAVSSYIIIADTMVMSGSGGSLRFRAPPDPAAALPPGTAPPAGSPPPPAGAAPASAAPPIAGTRWIAEGSTDPRSAPRLEFASDGRVTGYTGCNTFSGNWRLEGAEVRFSNLAVTKRMCTGDGAEIEHRLLTAFSEGSRVTREGDRLVVSSPSGARFTFSPAAAA